MTKVLVAEKIGASGIELLREHFEVDTAFDQEGFDLSGRIADYDGILIRSATKMTADLIEAGERLRVIGRAGVGVDNVDVEAASRRGILVANAPESTVISAAEHTLGLMLALSRNIAQAHAALKAGRWERQRFAGLELAGKTLGLVGFGRIGQQVARRAQGLEMRVVAHDPYVARERFRDLGVEPKNALADVLAEADFLSLHVTLTEETRGLIGREALAAAKEGMRIVNAARGELVDEEALLDALRSGSVAGAALDVFEDEPNVDPGLLELENVVLTPHIGSATHEARVAMGMLCVEALRAVLIDGDVPATAVT